MPGKRIDSILKNYLTGPVVLKFTERTKFVKALLICRLHLFVDSFSSMLNKDAITISAILARKKNRGLRNIKYQFNKGTMRVLAS